MTLIKKYSTPFWNVSKRILYAMQVMVLALAIPVLSYIEVSHANKKEIPAANTSMRILPAVSPAITLTQSLN